MSGPEHLPPDDHELEDFLAGRGPHRARYRAASQEQAPAALDAAVLTQARAAVATAPGVRTPAHGAARWRLPLSLAATLVLGVGLSTRVLRETPVLPSEPAPVAAAQELAAPAPKAAEETAVADAVVAPPAAAALAGSVAAESAARAGLAENREQVAAEHERRDRERAKSERQMQQAMAAAAPEVAAAPPPPPLPPVVAMKPQAAAEAFAPEVGAGRAMSDSVPPAAPPVAAMAAPAPRAEAQAKRRAAMSAPIPEPAAIPSGRYRAESGAELELRADGRFVLSLPAGAVLGGLRLRESGGERLRPDTDSDLACALWLQPLASEQPSGSVQLRADCESAYAGVYRREVAEP